LFNLREIFGEMLSRFFYTHLDHTCPQL
jgi:hypothetical protein